MAENTLRIALEEKETLFQQQFSTYQKNLRKYPDYIKYDAFKDLKLIFDLYSEIFHLKGFEYNKLSEDNLKKLIRPFSINEKKELIGHLVKSLAKNGNEDEAQYVIKLLNKIEISYYWNSIKSFKNILKSSLKLVHKIVSYNIWVLTLSIIIYLFISTLIFCDTTINYMKVIEVTKLKISQHDWVNNLGNLLTYIFELDEKMKVKPLNFTGVVVLTFQKSFLLLVIGSYLVKEIFNKIKLQ